MKIYISSTYEDLKGCRQKVYDILRKARHDVIAMEDYVATDQRPLDLCISDVESSDLYVGVFAYRYGFIPVKGNPQKRSVTELEYRAAGKAGKTRLVFLLQPESSWQINLLDSQTGDGDFGRRIQQFRAELMEEQTFGKFTNCDELAGNVVTAVYRVEKDFIRPPPVRVTRANSRRTLRATEATASARKGYPQLWKPGDVLRVRFLAGSPRFQERVVKAVGKWTKVANIRFEFGEDPDAEIRVGCDASSGSWAYVGPTCLTIPRDEITINLGWLTEKTSEAEFNRVTLHEFGHVLGLLHEHQNPEGRLPWKMPALYAMFEGPPNQWPRATIDATIAPWEPRSLPFKKPFDPDSIMLFSFPASVMKNGVALVQKSVLSPDDKAFIGRLYPF